MFRLSPDLQTLLEGTELGEFRISDVPWPFDSFVVLLAQPIPTLTPGEFTDAILVSRGTAVLTPDSPLVTVELLPQGFGTREYLPDRVVLEMEDAFRDKRKERLKKLLDRWGKAAEPYLRPIFHLNSMSGEYVKTSAAKLAENALVGHPNWMKNLNQNIASYPHWDGAVRIIAGLSLYLKSLPTKKHKESDRLQRSTIQADWQSVVNGADVCAVSSAHELSGEEHENLKLAIQDEQLALDAEAKGQTYEVRAHYRRGHWRRAPGTANNPEAPKVIHVRPTLVRRDRLPDGTAPRGSETRLK